MIGRFCFGLASAPVLIWCAAVPFWDSKPAAEWSLDEVRTLLTNSPWAQSVEAGSKSPAPPVGVYVASAEPVQAAEDRLRAARKKKDEDPSWDEYREYLVSNTGKYIVLAVAALQGEAFLDNSETRHMEEESRLLIGKRRYKLAGHFPPSSTDPYVRLVFPRVIEQGDRALRFELYVPGAGAPYRRVEFALKDMVYRGQPCY